MSRVFRRGELKQAVLLVAADLGEAHGYAIMSELEARVGEGWKASPGAIYPALLGLVDAGWLATEQRGDTRVYVVTESGRRAAERAGAETRWVSLTTRARSHDAPVTVGTLLDGFAANAPSRRRVVDADAGAAVREILDAALDQIDAVLDARPASEARTTEGDRDG